MEGDIWSAQLTSIVAGERCYNRLHYIEQESPTNGRTGQVLAEQFFTLVGQGVTLSSGSGVDVIRAYTRQVRGDGAPVGDHYGLWSSQSILPAALPQHDALVISFYAGDSGLGRRGRWHFSGFSGAHVDDGHIDETGRLLVEGFLVKRLLAQLTGPAGVGGRFSPCLWSVANPVPHFIVGARLRYNVGTVRTRTPSPWV